MSVSGEAVEAHDRHRDFYLQLAERAMAAWTTEQEVALFDELEAEQDNWRAALAWSEQQGDAERLARLTTALRQFWEARGWFEEGERWLGEALARQEKVPADARVFLLLGAAQMAAYLADYDRADGFIDEAERHWQGTETPRRRAEIVAHRAAVAVQRGELLPARALYSEARDRWRALGVPARLADSLISIGHMHLLLGEFPAAAACFGEARALYEAIGSVRGRADCLLSLGFLTAQAGDAPAALAMLDEALTILSDTRISQPLLARAVEAIVYVAAMQGAAARAATLFGAVEAFREQMRVPMPPAYQHLYAQALTAIHARLDDAAFAAAWEQGRALSIEQTVERTRALCR